MLMDGRTDGRTTDAGVTGILIAHLGHFGSGELKMLVNKGPVLTDILAFLSLHEPALCLSATKILSNVL